MKLIIPEPKITLYKDGFDDHDLLDRKPTGHRLSELVEKIDDPIVIALDGTWGSGKSFFLKCWVGAHLKREGNTTETVYFDAFQHDFMDDPLIALTAAIDRRINRDDNIGPILWEKAKNAAPALGRAALRVGVSLATAGIVNKVDNLVDAGVNALSGEMNNSVADFWKKEDSKRAAMDTFKQGLIGLTAPDGDGTPTKKLVIVIDELDRCRPDYALSLLEVIKHFFAVPNVHFVLGVNLSELQNSVKARYGPDIDAAVYLQKFIHVTIQIEGNKWDQRRGESRVYFDKLVRLHKFPQKFSNNGNTMHLYHEGIRTYLQNMPSQSLPNLRACERLVTSMVLSPESENLLGQPNIYITTGLLIMAAINPDTIRQAQTGDLSLKTVQTILGIGGVQHMPEQEFMTKAQILWQQCMSEGPVQTETKMKEDGWSDYDTQHPHTIIPKIAGELWGTFQSFPSE